MTVREIGGRILMDSVVLYCKGPTHLRNGIRSGSKGDLMGHVRGSGRNKRDGSRRIKDFKTGVGCLEFFFYYYLM